MKLTNIRFFATANSKGNNKSNAIIVLMIFLVISIALVPAFTLTVNNSVNKRTADFRSRALELDPWNGKLTKDALESIRNIEHVQEVYMLEGMRDQLFSVLEISDEKGICYDLQNQLVKEDSYAWTFSLIGSEKRDVISGKSLDESPVFSCIIPNNFTLDSSEENFENKSSYINGESLIGKTLTVTANKGEYLEVLYNYDDGNQSGNEWAHLPALKYKLKVVGVYYESATDFGYGGLMLVSEETGKLIIEEALEAAGFKLNSDKTSVEKWWSTPSLRTHYVIVDDYDNISYVYNEISKMGYSCANDPEMGMSESVLIISKILSVASVILLISPSILLVIILIQSTASNLKKRRGEIGLMKAVGYSDKNIFFCLCYEQLILAVKGFLIGGTISLLFVCIANYFNSKSSAFVNRLYIVDWSGFLTLLSISLAVSVVIPVVCQLIALKRLSKIQPKDAMNNM